MLAWVYASRGYRLIRHGVDPSTVRSINLELMVEPGVALLSIPAAFMHPALWQFSFALIPAIMTVATVYSRRTKG